jgi:hypothetical protein
VLLFWIPNLKDALANLVPPPQALCIARSPETPLVLTEACLQPPTLACPETAKELRGSAPENPP